MESSHSHGGETSRGAETKRPRLLDELRARVRRQPVLAFGGIGEVRHGKRQPRLQADRGERLHRVARIVRRKSDGEAEVRRRAQVAVQDHREATDHESTSAWFGVAKISRIWKAINLL